MNTMHSVAVTMPHMPNATMKSLTKMLTKLQRERARNVAAVREIDGVLARLGGASSHRGQPGTARSSGKRVQGVKEALLAALTAKPQSPKDLQKAVRRKLGAPVKIATQLNTLKREKKAKSAGRGLWVRS